MLRDLLAIVSGRPAGCSGSGEMGTKTSRRHAVREWADHESIAGSTGAAFTGSKWIHAAQQRTEACLHSRPTLADTVHRCSATEIETEFDWICRGHFGIGRRGSGHTRRRQRHSVCARRVRPNGQRSNRRWYREVGRIRRRWAACDGWHGNWGAGQCWFDSSCAMRGGICAMAGSLIAKIRRKRSVAFSVCVVIARINRAIAAAPPQPPSHKSVVKSRLGLRGLRKSGSGGACSIAMGSSTGESLKMLAESGKCCFHPRRIEMARVFCRPACWVMGFGEPKQHV